MPETPRVFIDSSVLFSATKSSLGGSFRLLDECARGTCIPVISKRVVSEVRLRLTEKYPELMPLLYNRLAHTDFQIVEPTGKDIVRCQTIINPDDAVILAGAIAARADYLATLDRAHFINDSRVAEKSGILILTPRDFLNAMRKRGLVD